MGHDSWVGDHDGRSSALTRMPLWVVALVAVVVPLVGIVAIAGHEVVTRWDHRDASLDQQRAAQDLLAVVEVRAALAEEETYTTIVVLARQLDVDPSGLGLDGSHEEALAAARSRLDDALARRPLTGLVARGDLLRELRADVDAERATVGQVDRSFAELEALVDEEIRAIDGGIEDAAGRRPMSERSRARLAALRDTADGVSHASARVGHALGIRAGGDPRTLQEDLVGLIRETALAEDAFDRARAGFGPRASEAWEAREEDPRIARLEDLMGSAVAIGLGAESVPSMSPEEIVEVLTDGLAWATRTIDVLQAAAADLEASAAAAVAAETRVVIRWVVGTFAAVALAVITVAAVARALRGAAADLERAARTIEAGQFDLPPLVPRGSREIAASVAAFNDMAATLEAVERHAVALAEEPDSPVLAEPLPGRTGQALQDALDRLRESVREAEQRRLELLELATHDGLTGLLNRRAAFEALERDLARVRRNGVALMVLYIDLDGLKVVNDTYGHAAGDEVIRKAADVLRTSTRKGDIVARLGGDEYLVAGPVPLGEPGRAQVRSAADRLLHAINRATAVLDDGTAIPLRSSIGVAITESGEETVEDLVRRADAALYVAKQSGRQQVAWPGG